jgi:tRNA-splicing ligase RtcB
MSTKVLSGKDIRKLGYPEGRVIAVVISTMNRFYKNKGKDFKLQILKEIIQDPSAYEKDEQLGRIVFELRSKTEKKQAFALNTNRIDYKIYGTAFIEEGARHQMEIAMKLPVTLAGSLMPDAHQGYGLPIGGVLAVENAVIPYGVGVDIGCRMCLSVFDLPAQYIDQHKQQLQKLLLTHTAFGAETFKKSDDHPILAREEFETIRHARHLKDRAWKQLGSSGSGNHFVEFGLLTIETQDPAIGVAPGQYLALLSHSGSRGLGAEIARHYTRIAKDQCKLPNEAQSLAWLDLNSEAGQEYWLAMNLAGDYASACHHLIHRKIGQALGESTMLRVENHHNFAWKETLADGREAIVHRKGATPAGAGVLGIIPGSMTAPGFVVRGKGNPLSLNSASHGAGRILSRSKAKMTFTAKEMRQALEKANVTLIGSGIDEAPMVYKAIRQVMSAQTELVEVLATFQPKIVRMCGDNTPAED